MTIHYPPRACDFITGRDGGYVYIGKPPYKLTSLLPHAASRFVLVVGGDGQKSAPTILHELLMSSGFLLPDAYEGWKPDEAGTLSGSRDRKSPPRRKRVANTKSRIAKPKEKRNAVEWAKASRNAKV